MMHRQLPLHYFDTEEKLKKIMILCPVLDLENLLLPYDFWTFIYLWTLKT